MLQNLRVFAIFLCCIGFGINALAEEGQSVLVDRNGDGVVSGLAFGDSITYGIGDAPNGGGFPARLSTLLGIPVENEGNPGEILTNGGADRFPSEIARSTADVVFILEGANDAVHIVGANTFANAIQRLVNVATVQGKTVVLSTLQKPTAQHGALGPFTDSYSTAIRTIALSNDLSIADYQTAWQTTCVNQEECELYNLPEGLHPTKIGYDVMGQVAAAAALGIDIFSASGAADLEGALNLPAGSVIVKPLPAG